MEETAEPILSFFDEEPGDLIREHRQYYLMVNAIARRVRQLQLGERALALPASGTRDPLYIASEEFLQGKLDITPRVGPAFTPFEEEQTPDLDALLGMDDEGGDFDADDDEE
jgi:DNA-directed RNA polymerase subunit K/omega